MSLAAQAIRAAIPSARIFLLEGGLGAGKTTFVKAFCEALDITEPVSSPTFNIVHEYQGNEARVYHFDLYRLRNVDELEEIGFAEYLDSGAYAFIEWPELALPFLEDEEYVLLSFSYAEDGGRNISARLHEKS